VTVWTDPAQLSAMLGPGVDIDPADDWVVACCGAANAAAFRKRAAAGYVDPPDPAAPAPSADIAMGTTIWAAALWRERASTDSYQSFEDLSNFQPTGGSWGTIKRLLGIGRGQVDDAAGLAALTGGALGVLRRRQRMSGWLVR